MAWPGQENLLRWDVTNASDQGRQGHRHYRAMTVANIRERKEADGLEVVFLESARFYRLPKDTPAYDDLVRVLRDAMATGRVLYVGVASPDGEIIEEVHAYG